MAISSQAQKLKNAFSQYQNGNFGEAYSTFNKMRTNPKETIAAHYGIGLLYQNPNNPKHNNITAYMNLSKAKGKYATASDDDKNFLRQSYNIDLQTITDMIDTIAAGEYAKAAYTNTVEGYYAFIRKYKESQKYCDMARRNIERIELEHKEYVLQILEQINTDPRYPKKAISGLNKYLSDFGRDKDFPRAKADSLARMIMDRAFQSGEPSDIAYIYRHLAPALIPKLSEKERHQLQTAQDAYSTLPFMEPYADSHKPIYEKYIKDAAPCDLAFVAVQKLMAPYISQHKYTEAANVLAEYRLLFPNMADNIDKTMNLLTGKAPEYQKHTKLPDEINKKYVGYPVLSADGKTLYFAQYPLPFNHPIDQQPLFEEDIYLSDYNNGKCTNVRPLTGINTTDHYERPSTMHPSGNELLYYSEGKIHIADLYGGKTPQQFYAINQIEGSSWVSDASYTFDGNAVLFCALSAADMGFMHPRTSSMAHGTTLGNPDIYICLKEDGKWGRIINLGPTINTPYGEFCPVLAADMKTLYFSSNGHYGLGGTDLYVSRRLSDTSWTEWSEPVNLGRNINTPYDDNNLCISTDGTTAFYVKDDDIYTFQLPNEIKAEPVSIVEGVVKNKKEQAIPARISWEDLSSGNQLGTLENNPISGEFFITLPQGKNYGYVIESDGYFPVSGNVNTSNNAEAVKIGKEIIMHTERDIIESGEPIVLQNIFFETGKYDLKKESYNELKRLAKFLEEDVSVKIEISGHTDNVGSQESNKRLSQNRANAVKKYLVSLGIAESRIRAEGFGQLKPIETNSTAEGRAKNRRVEFKVISE